MSAVSWPSRWAKSRVRAGYWLAEGHTIKRLTPTAGGWDVLCPRRKRRQVGGGEVLQDAVDSLGEHLWDCAKTDEQDPVVCAQSISDHYAPTCDEPRSEHCDDCLMCPGHHVDGCAGAEPLTIEQIAGPPRDRRAPWLRVVTVHLPEQVGVPA